MKVSFRQPEGSVVVWVEDAELARIVAALVPVLSEVEEEEAPPGPQGLWVGRTEEGFRLGKERYHALPDLLMALEIRLVRRLLEPLSGWVHLHAAGVLTEAGAVLGVGHSGAGKSSLALAWAAEGLPVLGDDLILVDDRGRVRGFPRLAKIHRDRLAVHGLTEADTLAPVSDHPEVWVDLHRNAPWRPGTHPVCQVARVRYEASRRSGDVRPLGSAALLQRLMEQLLSTGASGLTALDALVPLCTEARGGELSFSDACQAARRLAEPPAAVPA